MKCAHRGGCSHHFLETSACAREGGLQSSLAPPWWDESIWIILNHDKGWAVSSRVDMLGTV